MSYFYNVFGLLLLLGVLLIISIVIIYQLRKRQFMGKLKEGVVIMPKEKDQPSVPETFDLAKIERDLDILKDNKPLFMKYGLDLVDRFKTNSTVKVLQQKMRLYKFGKEYLQAVVELQDMINQVKDHPQNTEWKHKVEELRYKLEIAQLEKQIQNVGATEAGLQEEELKKHEEKTRFEYRKKLIEEKIAADHDMQKRQLKTDKFRSILEPFDADIDKIENESSYSPHVKKEMKRLREQLLIKDLDQLEREL